MKIRRIVLYIILAATLATVALFALSSAAVSDDPADSYRKRIAPSEDSTISMWFDYSFRKNFTSDKTSTGKDTFSIYMAKNEIEDAQFVLYSDIDHTGMKASLSAFTNSNGKTVDASIYYEMYVTTENLNVTNVNKATENTTFIREGETPDPIAPLANVGTFKLNGGKSQAFLIRAVTTTETQSGWYSAELSIMNSSGDVVKVATVYLYVWNFELSEKTALETAFQIGNNTDFGGNYKLFYDYLLENRMCGFDLPTGKISSANSYLTKDRVVSVRLSTEDYQTTSYLNRTNVIDYQNIYNDVATSPFWDDIKGKIYAYVADEVLPKSIVGSYRDTVDTANRYSQMTNNYWGDEVRSLVTLCANHLYPYDTFYKPLSTYTNGEIGDSVQGLIDFDQTYIWTPMLFEFTPYEEVLSLGPRTGLETYPIRTSSIYPYAGAYGGVGSGNYAFFDWEDYYGATTVDRYRSYIKYKNENNKDGLQRELWTYNAGIGYSYTYCNHLIENTGLQTKLMFWQCYQEDVTGYLYYATNNWTGYTKNYDSTVTGAKTTCQWYTDPYIADGYNAYGDGILFYGMSMGKIKGLQMIGTLRVELLRDGIEEYQMMHQLEELKGVDVAKSFVNSVSNNVVDYISMPDYDRSAWENGLDEYDIVESVRRALGNTLETAYAETKCDHVWDNGTVTKQETCQKTGVMTYTCTLCSATHNEVIPSIHSTDTSFVRVSGTAPTCTSSGEEKYECTLCGFAKTVRTYSNHANPNTTTVMYKNADMHSVFCNVCGEKTEDKVHAMYVKTVKPTCEAEGYTAYECKECGYKTNETVMPAVDHDYKNGVCTMCGQNERSVILGDVDGNGKVNSSDLNILTKYMIGTLTLSQSSLDAADVSGDGKINSADSNYMIKYISGVITAFN